MPSPVLNFGLLLLPEYQWLDAAGPVDYINNHSRFMISILGHPESLLDKAPIINWHYISHDMSPVRSTSGPIQLPSCTYEDCPPLDYLIIPGPDPSPNKQQPGPFGKFVKDKVDDPNFKGLLLICTASMAVANSGNGVLDGKQVCSNKLTLRMFSQAGLLKGTKIKWVGDKRWSVDGKIWSSAGITAGIDLAAEFAKRTFDAEIVRIAKDAAEYEEKPADGDAFARLLEGVKLD
ncbi:hypothetical protein D9613_006528 [Agrocybe pediades]|uniref:DJ-1/PfpI domain-containing protein n=1 Tax=Agrocybe pediades TaxID=84607 RepID=A0A8H4QH48_9AGAR|nr:hypothetical protein D9613_006528 [Agrocybe pediades]KAF9556498.1 class I glutamine amidotransferase-like protein [Agrocybe pediades]